MSERRPNPALVDLTIDRLEPGEDYPFELSNEALVEIEGALRDLWTDASLLENVLGLLALAVHAEDLGLDHIAVALRQIAETSADALARQTASMREEQRRRLGQLNDARAPMAGEKPPEGALRLSQLGALSPSAVRHRRAAALNEPSLNRDGSG